MILSNWEWITYEDLTNQLQKSPPANQHLIDSIVDEDASLQENLQNLVENFEKELISRALEKSRYHRSDAAKLLGMSRKSLQNKIKKYMSL